jgi:probable addiction module antidote protein
MKKFNDYIKEQFKDEGEITAFINAALEQYFEDHNKELFLATLKEVVIVRGGVTEIARQSHINRQHVYRMLSSKGNPSFENIGSLLMALGLKLKVENDYRSIH